MKIYIAENSLPVRQRLVQMIEEVDGMEVIGQTGSAIQAGEGIDSLRPEVALLDVHLDHGTAFEVLAALRRGGAATKVILISAHQFDQYRAKAAALGAAFYFDKAKEFDRIVPALRQLAGDQA